MRIDFYAPCSVSRWVDNDTKDYDGSISVALQAIEKQLFLDFCEDGAEFFDDAIDKLGYKIYSACYHMTVYDGKLYVRISVFMDFPKNHMELPLANGQVMKIDDDDKRNFKQFVDLCIDDLNGQMSDGWGECFEQHPFLIGKNEYYATAGNIEFASWYGIAVDNNGKMMRPIVYNQKSRLFDHGWIGGHIMELDMALTHISGCASMYDHIINHFDAFSMKEFEGELKHCTECVMKKYRVDRVFLYRFISWYIQLKKNSCIGLADKTYRQLRNYQKLFK